MLENLGVTVVKIDLPFRLNHVNCFLAEGEEGWTVIDAGLHRPETKSHWQEVLAGKDVKNIYVTHYHPDHFGYSGQLQKETGARVSMLQSEAETALRAWEKPSLDALMGHYAICNVPEKEAIEMADNTAEFVPFVTPYPTINHHFQIGEKVKIGRLEYEVMLAPGHSDGMVAFYNAEESVLFSADHILPRITPNISYWFHGDSNPLRTYLQSLEQYEQLNIGYVIPSHGLPFENGSKRMNEIRAHHNERLDALLTIIKSKHSIFEACMALFDFTLTIHELRFALGETAAHLEYLVSKGECRKKIVDGKWLYFPNF